MSEVRSPAVAGQFYAGSAHGCREQLARIDVTDPPMKGLPEKLVAAIVPHAGWDCSGAVAMRAYRAVERRVGPGATFVVFGTAHWSGLEKASVYGRGSWQTPLGDVKIDEELAAALVSESGGLIVENSQAHAMEHSIEVQVPMLRYVFGECRLVPVAMPPRAEAAEVGRMAAEVAARSGRAVFFVGTTDLTHYGRAHYSFAPHGSGRAGLEWVKKENDPRMIELMRGLKAEEVLGEARAHQNACGPGAVAATLAAARAMGSTGGHVLEYTTSYDVLRPKYGEEAINDFVGYVAMVF
jgi:hypothetical protein